jgi:hypothetical protein
MGATLGCYSLMSLWGIFPITDLPRVQTGPSVNKLSSEIHFARRNSVAVGSITIYREWGYGYTP